VKTRFEEFHGSEVGKGIHGELAGPIPLYGFADAGFVLENENDPPTVGGFKSKQFETDGSDGRSRAKIGKLERIGEDFVLHISWSSASARCA
jgi:hypothetical protein